MPTGAPPPMCNNDFDAAAELCTAVLRSSPRNARALYLRAVVYQKAGNLADAAEDAVQAARLRPDLPPLLLAAGSLLCRIKCYSQALALYETALETSPGNAQYHLGAASALRKLGCGERAQDALLSAVAAAAAADPRDVAVQAQAHYKLGQHLRGDQAQYCLAVKAYERCLELDPSHALAAFWLPATRKFVASAVTEPHGNDRVNDRAEHAGNGKHALNAPPSGGGKYVAQKSLESLAAPTAAPREYVVGLYNAYAETFDSHLQGALEYRTPAVIVEKLRALFPGRRWTRCLDLGCGTGLSGRAVSSICNSLVGVDLSPAMVSRARAKRVYRRLIVGDVTDTVKRLHLQTKAASESGCGTESAPSGGTRTLWDVPEAPDEDGGAPVGAAAMGGLGGEGDGIGEECSRTRAAWEGVALAAGSSGVEGGGSAVAVVSAADDATILTLAPKAPSEEVSGAFRSSSGGGIDRGKGGGDLVLSCDVFGYIGDLRACFGAVHDLVAGGQSASKAETGEERESPRESAAVFAFSAEAPPVVGDAQGRITSEGTGRPGYELQGTGRYSHSREYLEAVARDAGFRVLASSDVVLRKNAGLPVRGFVFVTEAVFLATPIPPS